jgi:putative salt-induced outer membrane protein YdiY
MKPVFIYVSKRGGGEVAINVNLITHYELTMLSPGVGMQVFFSESFSIDLEIGPKEFRELIEQAIEENNRKPR